MFARTERLTLRPVWPEDAPALMAIGHDRMARLLSRGLPVPAEPGAWIAAPRGAHEPRFLIETHEGARPALIGGIGLSDDASDADLAFWLTPPARGRGYATEAARAVVEMARHALPLTRLHARHCASDTASARVLQKLGFRSLGRHTAPAPATTEARAEMVYDLDVARRTTAPPLAA